MIPVSSELRHAVRRLARSPGYALGVFVTLTLGLAFSVGMYTILNGVVLQGLPYPGGERVVEISGRNSVLGESHGSLTAAEAFGLPGLPELEHAGWYVWGGATVLSGDRPREITINHVNGEFFPALGMRPQLGRWIAASDLGPARRAVVLSDAEWERLTHRDPDVIGKSLRLGSGAVTVVGVMPPGFRFPADHVGMWRAADPAAYSEDPVQFLNARFLNAVGKVAVGVDAGAVERSMAAMMAAIRADHGRRDDGWRLQTTSLLELAVGDVRKVLAGVFLVSLLVLAIACANVGGLLAARMAAREHELAIIQALGAAAGRVWRSVLFELLLLAAAAIVAALLMLMAGLEAFSAMAAGVLPRADEVGFDPAVLAFAAGLGLLCPLLVSLPFGLRLRKRMAANLQGSSKGTGTTSGALRALPVTGLALATAAVIAGAAVSLSLDRLGAVDPGFRTDDVYAVKVYHGGDPRELRRFATEVLTRVRSEPDLEMAAMTTSPPLSLVSAFNIDVQVPGREQPEPLQAGLRRVTPRYLDVLQQPLLHGRHFLPADDHDAPKVAIVNRTFAERVFSDSDVLGRDIDLPLGSGPRMRFRIVGVAADIRNAGLRRPPDPEILVPFEQVPWLGMVFLAYAPNAGSGLLERMQEAIWAVDPEEAMTRVYRLEEEIDAQLAQVRFFARMLGGFALAALLLAAFGCYSVIAFMQRRQCVETGVRLALGAPPADIARRVFSQGALLALLAGSAGSLGAVLVLRLLGDQLYGVGAASPQLYLFGLAGVFAAALLASAPPACRAARIQPMRVLREE